jgi:predicted DCC family thiol-disulfide oxidoreductase YuxK
VKKISQETARGAGQQYTLVYDGSCRMCGSFVNALRSWDTRQTIEIVPAQAAGAMARFPWIPERAFAAAIQLVGPGGATTQGAAAIEEILGVLPRGKWIAWIFKVPFVRGLADRIYRWVARNRYRMGCREHCQSRPPGGAMRD